VRWQGREGGRYLHTAEQLGSARAVSAESPSGVRWRPRLLSVRSRPCWPCSMREPHVTRSLVYGPAIHSSAKKAASSHNE
jgi:hypothetical protein